VERVPRPRGAPYSGAPHDVPLLFTRGTLHCSVFKTEDRPLRSGNSKKGWLAWPRRREGAQNLRGALNAGTQRRPRRIGWGGINRITACDPCMRFWKLRSRSYATMSSDGARQGSDAAMRTAPLAGVADRSFFEQWPPEPVKARKRTRSRRLQTGGFSCRISPSQALAFKQNSPGRVLRGRMRRKPAPGRHRKPQPLGGSSRVWAGRPKMQAVTATANSPVVPRHHRFDKEANPKRDIHVTSTDQRRKHDSGWHPPRIIFGHHLIFSIVTSSAL